jgi:hypothetical protein
MRHIGLSTVQNCADKDIDEIRFHFSLNFSRAFDGHSHSHGEASHG